MAAQQPCTTPLEVFEEIEQRLSTADLALDAQNLRTRIDTAFRPLVNGVGIIDLQLPIEEFAQELGELVFGAGSLSGVTVGWNAGLLTDRAHPSVGVTHPPVNGQGPPSVEIEPYPFGDLGQARAFSMETDSIMSTVLHEIVHALMHQRACKGQCGRPRCHYRFEEQLGVGGHGDGWMRVAASVERFVQRHGIWHCDMLLKVLAERHYSETGKMLIWKTQRHCWPAEIVSVKHGSLKWCWI